MKRSLISLALAAAAVIFAPLSQAALFNLFVNLSGANEVPPNGSSATGSATLLLDTTAHTLTGHIVYSGLSAGLTGAHIHCCLATPFLSANVGVATPVPAFPGSILGSTSGIVDFVLQLNQASGYNPGFITAAPQNGSLAAAEANFVAGLTSGRTYLNLHTSNNPGGEIRGFVVPEPMTLSLLAMGLMAAAFASRRRKPV